MTPPTDIGQTLDCPHCRAWTWWLPEGPRILDRLECEACGAAVAIVDVDGPKVATVRVDHLTPAEAERRVTEELAPYVLRTSGPLFRLGLVLHFCRGFLRGLLRSSSHA